MARKVLVPIQSEHDVDTVYASAFEWLIRIPFVDIVARTGGRRGNRFIFIPPFLPLLKSAFLYVDDRRLEGMTSAEGTNIKALLTLRVIRAN